MKLLMNARRPLLGMLALLAAALSACNSMPTMPTTTEVDIVTPTSIRPVAQAAPAVNNGSIFQTRQYRPLFEDHRARLVGDTLTVQIAEKLSASSTTTSSVSKTGSAEAGVSALPFLPPALLGKLGVGANSANKFDGKGGTVNTNDFTGVITATVVEVLPNGHLIVAGEKQIGVNQNVDVLRFSGQVDPRAIQPGNTVVSAQIANVRVDQRGRGQQGDAQQIGWLSRFFLSVLPI